MCFLLQKQSFWLRYIPICVTRQISRNSTMVRSTWLPVPKTHTQRSSLLRVFKNVSACPLIHLCCNKSAETPLPTWHALFFFIKTIKVTPFRNILCKISISHTGRDLFFFLSRPVFFFLLYICLFFWFMCDFVRYLTESCSEEAAHTAVRTLIDLGVSGSFYLGVCVSKSAWNFWTHPTQKVPF